MAGSLADFTSQITLGSVLVIFSIIGMGLTIRSQVFKHLHERADIAEDALKEREAEVVQLKAELAAEKVKTDLTPILEEKSRQTAQVLGTLGEMMVRWDGASDKRAERIMLHADQGMKEITAQMDRRFSEIQKQNDSQIRVLTALEQRINEGVRAK